MLYAVILAGGEGMRLWPLSRPHTPKQFLSLLGERSLLQQTVLRVEHLVPPERVVIVTGVQQQMLVQTHLSQLPGFATSPVQILTEPLGRNTAAAIGLAALYLQQIDPDAIMLVLPADHWIEDNKEFSSLVQRSLGWTEQGLLVTFGIVPSRPETGYGYIQRGELHACSLQDSSAYHVARFIEKPARAAAQEYVARGDYYWNAGIFLWQAAAILQEMKTFLLPLVEGLQEVAPSLRSGDVATALAPLYSRWEAVSIDHGVLEKSDQLVVVPMDMGWSDLGDWTTIHALSPRDERGNAVGGQAFVVDSKNSFIYSSHRPIAAIGLSNLVVVETEDAVLVCTKESVQEVKTAGQYLREQGAVAAKASKVVQRPWGTYTVLEEQSLYKVKRLLVAPAASLSLQYHQYRNEHWVVVQGTARVTNGEQEFLLYANQSTYIPQGALHRLANPGPGLLEIIEVQTGSYLGEDDIVRCS